jgi:hypothetical protein
MTNQEIIMLNVHNLHEKLAEYFSKKYNILITRQHIISALLINLADEYNLEWEGDILDFELSFEQALHLLNDFNFLCFQNYVTCDPEFFPEGILKKNKVRFKDKGVIWIIHKSDKDPKPSNPHAHNLENNIKLDLSNGNYYIKTQFIGSISKKDLIRIREKAEVVYKGELPKLNI